MQPQTVAPAMSQPSFTMPARNHHSAPQFDGKSEELDRYFSDLDRLASRANLNGQDKIEYALHYVSVKISQLWGRLPESTGADWAAFKKAVLALYPETVEERKFTVLDLENLVERQAALPLSTRDHLGEYYRDFFDLASYLKDASKLTDREISQLFTRGFPISFRTKVRERLVQKHPDHHPDDPYTLKQIYDSAQWILSGGLPMLPSSSNSVSISKIEPMDAQTLVQAMMAALVPAITQSMVQSITPLIQQLSPSNTATNASTTRALLCLFCGLVNCRIGSCAKAEDYINTGKCKRVNGRIQLPDGTELGRDLPGFNFQQKIDNWFASNPNAKTIPISEQNRTAHPRATVGLWQVAEPSA
jgi:hypothetical protein